MGRLAHAAAAAVDALDDGRRAGILQFSADEGHQKRVLGPRTEASGLPMALGSAPDSWELLSLKGRFS